MPGAEADVFPLVIFRICSVCAEAGEMKCKKLWSAEKPRDLCIFLWLYFPVGASPIFPEKYEFLTYTNEKSPEALSPPGLWMTTGQWEGALCRAGCA